MGNGWEVVGERWCGWWNFDVEKFGGGMEGWGIRIGDGGF